MLPTHFKLGNDDGDDDYGDDGDNDDDGYDGDDHDDDDAFNFMPNASNPFQLRKISHKPETLL